ncbi:MAG TPA: tyrosine-type recombinase/integrase [Candidatus Limnocylindria bacterium]|jgi:integrase|nr:tyrosine-type recombinase/integrase [Candidatus Limnocylindria bacterium]HTL67234.1 tyrosine-type recombinase/integrase [Lacunisphaera sp.]
MSGRRPLTRPEEKQLLRVVRRLPARDRAVITAAWFMGFRISEVLALTVGHVWRNDAIVDQVGVAPRHLKGKRGRTRWVPVLPELRRALTHQLWWLRLKFTLSPDLPLFPSRKAGPDGRIRAISRVQAHHIIKAAFAAAGIADDGRLGTHTLRKTLAQSAYRHCRDPLVIKEVLGHAELGSTLAYLEADAGRVQAAFAACDFTRRPRKVAVQATVAPVPRPVAPLPVRVTEQLALFPDQGPIGPAEQPAVA